jgi:hypothetical protein
MTPDGTTAARPESPSRTSTETGHQEMAQLEPGEDDFTANVRSFIRRQLLSNTNLSDQDIQKAWSLLKSGKKLQIRTIKRERTLFAKLRSYDQRKGLIDFFDSQAQLMLAQYKNIEQLLGPADSDWAWPGEHCETLLRQAIAQHLPPNYAAGKGYVLGVRNTEKGPVRSPEIDILVYDAHLFPPIFRMGHFVIVRPEAVVAVIQVKRSLDVNTLTKALANVIDAKQHVANTCSFNAPVIVEKLFAGVVCFQDSISKADVQVLSTSYRTAIQPYVSEFRHGYFLPDFVGTLDGVFLHFLGMNLNDMGYQAFPSVDDGKNIALPFFLFMLIRKIRPFGLEMPPAIPERLRVIEYLKLWEKPAEEANNDPQPT